VHPTTFPVIIPEIHFGIIAMHAADTPQLIFFLRMDFDAELHAIRTRRAAKRNCIICCDN
jgi:hypothetical protein